MGGDFAGGILCARGAFGEAGFATEIDCARGAFGDATFGDETLSPPPPLTMVAAASNAAAVAVPATAPDPFTTIASLFLCFCCCCLASLFSSFVRSSIASEYTLAALPPLSSLTLLTIFSPPPDRGLPPDPKRGLVGTSASVRRDRPRWRSRSASVAGWGRLLVGRGERVSVRSWAWTSGLESAVEGGVGSG